MTTYFTKKYPLSFLTACVIIFLSLYPFHNLPKVDVPLADKWTHMVMYGALTLVIWFDYKRTHRQYNSLRLLLFAFLAPIAMGGTLELMQAYLTTCRSGEWLDLVANTIGVCIGSIVGILLLKVPKKLT